VKAMGPVRVLALLRPMLGILLFVDLAAAQTNPPEPKYPDFPSETPAKFEPVTTSFDHTERDVMIPMRDGVKLHTVIFWAKPGDYRRATQRVYHAPDHASFVELPVVTAR